MRKKLNKKNAIISILVLFIFFSFINLALAQTQGQTQDLKYRPLEPIPIPGGGPTTGEVTPDNYFRSLYWWFLGFAIATSVLLIIVGGFEYTLSWANEKSKGEAKNRIESAITGLILALTSWLILNTINPKLTQITLPKLDMTGISPISSPIQPPPSVAIPNGGGTPPSVTNPYQPIPGQNLEDGAQVVSPTGVTGVN